MSCADSLRLVQGVLEVNEIKSMREELRKLREENALLKKELDLWKNDCELPVVGEYYTAPNELLQLHGWEFDGYAESMALCYDGTRWKTVSRVDGTEKQYLLSMFTAPYRDDGRESWIVFEFETYELHSLSKVHWNEFQWVRYLDTNDSIVVGINITTGRSRPPAPRR